MNTFSPSKKLSRRDIEDALNEVSSLGYAQEEYVERFLSKYLGGGGVSKFEVEQAILKIKEDTTDPIERGQADRIKQKLLEILE